MSESIDQALQWCRRFRINLDPMEELGWDGEVMTFVRLRPWQQDKRAPIMFVGAGSTFGKACRCAMENAVVGNSKPLSWAWRPWSEVAGGRSPEPTPEDLPF